MTASVAPAPEAPAPVSAPETGPISARDAAIALSSRRWGKTDQPKEPPKENVEAAPVAEPDEPAGAQDAGDAETAEAEQPALDPPKSWTKEAQEKFSALDRETQAYLLRQEEAREAEIKKATASVGERDKALAKEREAIQQMRAQYEQALPVVMNYLEQQRAGQFADIKTPADVRKMAETEPHRYLQYLAHQEEVRGVMAQMQAVAERNKADIARKWQEYSTEQDKKFAEVFPELSDPEKRAKMEKAALGYLTDIGFENDELAALWGGDKGISIRDAKIQRIIADATRFREAQEALKKAKTQAVPPVQRPGVAQPKGAGDAAKLKELNARLTQTGSPRDAAALLAARRARR